MRMQMLDQSYFTEIMSLEELILANLKDESSFQALTVDELKHIFAGNGMIAGALVSGKVIGFSTVLFPGLCDANLGRDIGLAEHELEKVVQLEISCVHPDFRGQKLQAKLFSLILKEISKSKKYRYLLSTVAPGNYPSMQNLFYLGMVIYSLKYKYGDKLRYIFCQDLTKSQMVNQDKVVSVDTEDISKQHELFEQGYCAVGLKKYHLQFTKIMSV